MKHVLIVIDGMSDEPCEAMAGKTPLEVASIPHIETLCREGVTGSMKTTFEGFPIESALCITGLLGYEPALYYPCGRASFEAMGRGITVDEDDLVLRCNIVTIDEKSRVINDFTGGLRGDADASAYIAAHSHPMPGWEIRRGQGYRHLLIVRGGRRHAEKLQLSEPHMHQGVTIDEIMPRGLDAPASRLAGALREIMVVSETRLPEKDSSGPGTAHMLWPWSPSTAPAWPSFHGRTGCRGAVVCGIDLLRGIAITSGLHCEHVPGATGDTDTDYRAKGVFGRRHIRDFDFVLIHINAPDEMSHRGDYEGKTRAIESVDRYVIGPVLDELRRSHEGDYRLLVCGDHCTRTSDGRHTDSPVPFVACGAGIPRSGAKRFTESACCRDISILSLELIGGFVSGTQKGCPAGRLSVFDR